MGALPALDLPRTTEAYELERIKVGLVVAGESVSMESLSAMGDCGDGEGENEA